jgi:membrane associated rhomboid family serine protease
MMMNNISGTLGSEARSTFKQRVIVPGILLALLWGIEAVDWLLGGKLDQYGIRPRELGGLWGILFAPFLHGSWDHLAANSVTLLVLSWLVLLRGMREYLEVSIVIVLLGGFGTWLIGQPHTVHIGASGLIFGYFGFLILRGLLDLNWRSILSGLAVGLLYGGLIGGFLSSRPGVSWAGHVCGFLSGLLSARMLGQPAQRRPPG